MVRVFCLIRKSINISNVLLFQALNSLLESKKKNINESNMDDSFSVASKLSVIICLYITLFYQVSIEYQQAEYYSSIAKSSGLFVLSFIQLVFTILYVFYWYQLRLWYNPDTINREGNK